MKITLVFVLLVFVINVSPQFVERYAGNGVITTYNGEDLVSTSANLYGIHIIEGLSERIIFSEYTGIRVRSINRNTNRIKTIMGNGTTGSSPDGMYATSASILNNPYGIALDNNYIWIVEINVIRSVDLSSGLLYTYAGTTQGYAGDGGPAISAKFYSIRGIKIALNYLWIVDFGNHVVRRVDLSTNTVTLFAGKPNVNGYKGDGGYASNAIFNGIGDIYVDSSFVYITDRTNNVIRRVSLSTMNITTYIGYSSSGNYYGDGGPAISANFNNLYQITGLDNNIWIADRGNNRIRFVSAKTGIITTLVGTGVSASAGDGGYPTSALVAFPIGIYNDGEYLFFTSGSTFIRRVRIKRSSIVGDPHFIGLSGGSYTIDLKTKQCYNIFQVPSFQWKSCSISIDHRPGNYFGLTTFDIYGHRIVVSPNLLFSLSISFDNHTITNKLWKHSWNCGPITCLAIATKLSLFIKVPCITFKVRISGRVSCRLSRNKHYQPKHKNYLDFYLLSNSINNSNCKVASGLLGDTWNKPAHSTGKHGEGVLKRPLIEYEVQNIIQN